MKFEIESLKLFVRMFSSGAWLHQRSMSSILPNRLCFATGEKYGMLHSSLNAKIYAETKPEIGSTIYIAIPVGRKGKVMI
jgi:hypothetical protein